MLFAALDVATGKVIGKCFRLHRSEEFRKFLNYMFPRHPLGQLRDPQDGSRWFAEHPRWHIHYTSTSASNQVERFFGLLTEKQPRRGVHWSTADLDRATVNDNPKPFRWICGRNSDSTILPTNAGNLPGSGHKCTNFGIETLQHFR